MISENTVTVITPVYNMGKYLHTCIESILGQTYKDFILLLVDDGSTDESGKICDDYASKDNRVQVIHTINRGQDAARNIALENVHTNYLAMIDSDDCVNIHFLEVLVSHMRETGADIVGQKYRSFYSDAEIDYTEEVNEKAITIYTQKEAMEELCRLGMGWFVMPQKLYRTKVFQDVIYPPVRVNIDEWTIHHLVLNSNNIAFVDANLYYYRQSEEGMTRNFSKKKFSGVRALLDRIDTVSGTEYSYLIGELHLQFYNKAKWFFNECDKAGLDFSSEYAQLQGRLKEAYSVSISQRRDLFSRKELLKAATFARNYKLYKMLDAIIK